MINKSLQLLVMASPQGGTLFSDVGARKDNFGEGRNREKREIIRRGDEPTIN